MAGVMPILATFGSRSMATIKPATAHEWRGFQAILPCRGGVWVGLGVIGLDWIGLAEFG